MDIAPITLSGKLARLEPLHMQHLDDLCQVAFDQNIWQHMVYGSMNHREDLRTWITDMLQRQQAGNDLPFAILNLENGRAVGCTRYMDIRRQHRGLEIGGSWLGTHYQRTGLNTEAKYLLLRHAFEQLGCVRVMLKTDVRNEKSRLAIERLGALYEGRLRNHMILPDGSLRDSAVYSIIASEWPQVKARLEHFMHTRYASAASA